MVATLVQIGILVLMRKKVDTMLWVTFGLIAVLGGATDLVPRPDLHQVEAERARTG